MSSPEGDLKFCTGEGRRKHAGDDERGADPCRHGPAAPDRKSTRLNSSHLVISYAVFCLKKKEKRCSTGSSPSVRSPSGYALVAFTHAASMRPRRAYVDRAGTHPCSEYSI